RIFLAGSDQRLNRKQRLPDLTAGNEAAALVEIRSLRLQRFFAERQTRSPPTIANRKVAPII
ncbi:MAG: hypothetical protein RLZZ444_772, partial [Pseudomonadota bacterium]